MHSATRPRCSIAVTPPTTETTIARLQHDLSDARERNATLLRELHRAATSATVASALPGPHSQCPEIVYLSSGIRWERRYDQASGTFHFCESGVVPGTMAAVLDGLFVAPAVPFTPEQARGMGVLA